MPPLSACQYISCVILDCFDIDFKLKVYMFVSMKTLYVKMRMLKLIRLKMLFNKFQGEILYSGNV